MNGVFVLGHRGMLGHMVVSYLQQSGCEVKTSEQRYTGKARDPLLQEVRESGCEWFINAIGAIPQKVSDPNILYRLNTQFPLHLLQELSADQRLLHASSDCVFSGSRGEYQTDDRKDATTDYGLSKALGEAVALDPRVLCFRVSILGPELGEGRGLLGWFMGQGNLVEGYTNHQWNGITSLEWAKAALEAIRDQFPHRQGLVQLGVSDALSKFELLQSFAEIWAPEKQVNAAAAPIAVDRTLLPDEVRPPLSLQLRELAKWMENNATKRSFHP